MWQNFIGRDKMKKIPMDNEVIAAGMTMKEQIDSFIASRSSFRASELAEHFGFARGVAVAYLLRYTELQCDDSEQRDPLFKREEAVNANA